MLFVRCLISLIYLHCLGSKRLCWYHSSGGGIPKQSDFAHARCQSIPSSFSEKLQTGLSPGHALFWAPVGRNDARPSVLRHFPARLSRKLPRGVGVCFP